MTASQLSAKVPARTGSRSDSNTKMHDILAAVTAPDLDNARELVAALHGGLAALGCTCTASSLTQGSDRLHAGSFYIVIQIVLF